MTNENEKRTHCVSVRLNPDELLLLDRLRGRVQRGSALRRMLLGQPLPLCIPTPTNSALRQLTGMANNINQLARYANINEMVELNNLREVVDNMRLLLISL